MGQARLERSEQRRRMIEEEQQKYRCLGKVHTDAEYGHQPGEVNFWMPLTYLDETSTLWAETAPDKGDWYPILAQIGQAWHFPGSVCRHFTKPNISGRTRISRI